MAVVLIAFERESEQTAVEQLLTGRGHQVHRSANGLAALDAARRDPPDLIVSDIVLPRMDGFALCRKWKQDERLQTIPFIFYTRRHDDPKYERFALELGAERFLARSVAPDALLGAVDELSARAPARAPAPTAPAPAMMATGAHTARASNDAALKQLEQKHLEAIERAKQTHERLKTQVSELESMNERLSASETRFRRIFEANPLPMWIADHETGGFIAVNDAAIEFYGYSRPEFLSMKASALAFDPKTERNTTPLQHKRKNGALLTVGLSVQEIDFDGRRADLVAAFDLSDQLAREKQLREEAQASRALLESIPDGVLILDGSNRIVEVNPAYCRMSGYSRDELIKMKLADIEDQSSGEETLKLHMGRTSGSGRYEVKHRRRDGTFIEVEAALAPSVLADGESMLVIRDVSQRRRELLANKAQQRQLQFLVDLFKQSESFDESAIVRRLIDQANDVTNSPLSFLYFVSAEQDAVQLAAWKDRAQSHATMASGEALPISKANVFSECVRAKRASSSNDLSLKPQADGLPSLQRYLAVPIVADEHAVAILGVANREAGYTETDQRNLSALADGAWRVLHAKRAHAQTLGSLQRTDVALQAMIDAFVRVTERHDPHTAGSSRRLAALAVALAREAGLDGERQHGLRIAALLHDVGNIAVPATILSKPGPLTETELALMRTHVEEGCRLLAEIDFGAPIADIVYQSHERYDGSGYPRGLKGEEILLEARILGIADTVEAMCSPRPYRPAAGMDAAIDEINRGAGRLYDVELVNACTRLVRKHGFVLPE